MKTFLAKIKVSEGRTEEFEKYCNLLSIESYKYEAEGMLVYDLLKSEVNPREYLWYAKFKTENDFELHMKTDYHDKYVPLILDCLETEMELTFPEFVC
jgi:quinol monooxygenase YgiN